MPDFVKNEEGYHALIDCIQSERDVVFLTGAGFSRRSGIPLGGEIIQYLDTKVEETDLSNLNYADAWECSFPAEENKEARRVIIEEVIAGRPPLNGHYPPPNDTKEYLWDGMTDTEDWSVGGHYLLANLIERGVTNAVITTNFDHLHEISFNVYCSLIHQVFQYDDLMDPRELEAEYPKLFKLHGDFLYEDLANLSDEMRRRVTETMREILIEFLQDRALVVIGYGGNDDSVMSLLESAVVGSSLSGGVWWVSHGQLDNHDKIESLRDALNRNDKTWHLLEPVQDAKIKSHRFLQSLTADLDLEQPEVAAFGVDRSRSHVIDSLAPHFGRPRQFGPDPEDSAEGAELGRELINIFDTPGTCLIKDGVANQTASAVHWLRKNSDRPVFYFSHRFAHGLSWQVLLKNLKLFATANGISTKGRSDYTQIITEIFERDAIVIIDDIYLSGDNAVRQNYWEKLELIRALQYATSRGTFAIVADERVPDRNLVSMYLEALENTQYLSTAGILKRGPLLITGASGGRISSEHPDDLEMLQRNQFSASWESGELEPEHTEVVSISVSDLVEGSDDFSLRNDIEDHLQEFQDESRQLLKILSQLRNAEEPEFLSRFIDGDVYPMLAKYDRAGLVESRQGRYLIKDEVRQFINEKCLSGRDRDEIHERTAQVFVDHSKKAHQTHKLHYSRESEYHYYECGEEVAALRAFLQFADQLIALGFDRFVFATIKDFFETGTSEETPFDKLDPDEQIHIFLIINQTGNQLTDAHNDRFGKFSKSLLEKFSQDWEKSYYHLAEGLVAQINGHYQHAIRHLEQAESAHNGSDSLQMLGEIRRTLANCHNELMRGFGNHDANGHHIDEFLNWNKAAIGCFRESGDKIKEAECLDDRALVRASQESPEAALSDLREARDMLIRQEGVGQRKAVLYGNLSAIHQHLAEQRESNAEFLRELRNSEGYFYESASNYIAAGNKTGVLNLLVSLLETTLEGRRRGLREKVPSPSHIVAWAFELWPSHRGTYPNQLEQIEFRWLRYIIVEQTNYVLLKTWFDHQNQIYRYLYHTEGYPSSFLYHIEFVSMLVGQFDISTIIDRIIPELECHNSNVQEALKGMALLMDTDDIVFNNLYTMYDIPDQYWEDVRDYLRQTPLWDSETQTWTLPEETDSEDIS